jgi:aryl-alcohol dehydrogenase-like predicted oxidoreductase
MAMTYRDLGRTGVKVSPLCLGCMNLGWKTVGDEAMNLVDRALDAGINFLDTANVYHKGASEEVVGQALKRNGKRDRIVLATKVWGVMDPDDPNGRGPSRRHILMQCEASLRRLQTDWIDLYQIHKPSHDVPTDESLRALDDLVRSGKVRYLGTTTFPAWRIMESLWLSDRLGLNRFVTEQPPYHLLDRRIERELVPLAQAYGMALIPWSPLASGFLTGKYGRSDIPADWRLRPGTHRGDQMIGNAKAQAVIDVLQKIALSRGASCAQVALAWNLNQPGITAPIIGPRTMDQLEDNLGALNVTLTSDDRQMLDAVSPPGDKIVPYLEADWATPKYR